MRRNRRNTQKIVKNTSNDVIKIEGTDDHPTVFMDANPDQPCFEITGKSLPEDVIGFYEPIIEWLKEYSENPLPETKFKVKLEYFNTATSKMLLDIFLVFEEMSEKGYDVLIYWHYPDDDEDIQEAGEEYEEIVECPFEHIPYEY